MRATPILLFLYTCLIPVLLKAQLQKADGTQLKVLFPSNMPGTYVSFSEHFNQRYRESSFREIEVANSDLYFKKGVKSIEVLDGRNKLQYTFEFDTSGKMIRNGHWGNLYFKVVSNHNIDSLHRYSSESYYDQEDKLVRSDTAYSETRQYSHADTLIILNIKKRVVYKRGSLINEQNKYYNEKWLGEKVNLEGTFGVEHIPYLKFIGKEYYLEDRLKTSYKSDSLYACIAQDKEHLFWASADKGRSSLEESKLSKHAFCKANKLKSKKKYLVDGEDFEEPFHYDRREPSCTSTSRLTPSETRYQSYLFSTNENGLYDSCYFFYYQLERVPLITKQDSVVRAEIADQIAKGKRIMFDPYTYTDEYVRASTPTKSLKFTFKYEYFEERKK